MVDSRFHRVRTPPSHRRQGDGYKAAGQVLLRATVSHRTNRGYQLSTINYPPVIESRPLAKEQIVLL